MLATISNSLASFNSKAFKSFPGPFRISCSQSLKCQKKTCDHQESSSKHFEHHAVCQQFFAKNGTLCFSIALADQRLSSGARAKGSAIQDHVFYSFMI